MDLILPEGALPVFWDINKCPVTNEGHARRVGPWINRFLRMKLKGYSGRIAITAVGQLSKVPVNILEAVVSSGITLYDVSYGRKDIDSLICIYQMLNPLPTKVMLIVPPQSYTFRTKDCVFIFPMDTCTDKADAKIFWQTCLADVRCMEGCKCNACRRVGTVGPAIWVCDVCDNTLSGRGFENYMRHRSSSEHTHELFVHEQEKMIEDRLKRLTPEERYCLPGLEEEDIDMARRLVLPILMQNASLGLGLRYSP